MTSSEKFIAFMRRLTGQPGLFQLGSVLSWRIHGVLVSYWFTAGTVKIYQNIGARNNAIDDTSNNRWTCSYFQHQQEACREHLANLTWRHPRP